MYGLQCRLVLLGVCVCVYRLRWSLCWTCTDWRWWLKPINQAGETFTKLMIHHLFPVRDKCAPALVFRLIMLLLSSGNTPAVWLLPCLGQCQSLQLWQFFSPHESPWSHFSQPDRSKTFCHFQNKPRRHISYFRSTIPRKKKKISDPELNHYECSYSHLWDVSGGCRDGGATGGFRGNACGAGHGHAVFFCPFIGRLPIKTIYLMFVYKTWPSVRISPDSVHRVQPGASGPGRPRPAVSALMVSQIWAEQVPEPLP